MQSLFADANANSLVGPTMNFSNVKRSSSGQSSLKLFVNGKFLLKLLPLIELSTFDTLAVSELSIFIFTLLI